MFVLTTLVYPVVLALLCLGGALLIDRASGGVVPAMLFPAVGAAGLIVVSQLSTYVVPIAPATPYLLVAVALAGLLLGWTRLRTLARTWRASLWQLLVCPLAYALALAPVLLAGRPTFSSYMALADSAVHMLGADFLIRHGQDYSHLDLRNSYGAFMHAYYGSSYPSGADTLFGGSSFLLRLPLIWTFQPFTAFMLATAAGPSWVLVRRVGLRGGWAAMATLTMTLPALVYAYELIGSVKEIAALPLILCMGALVVDHRRWLWRGARGAIPFALVLAAGVAALGVAFGAWALAAVLVLALTVLADLCRGMAMRRREGTSGQVIEPENDAQQETGPEGGEQEEERKQEHEQMERARGRASLHALLALVGAGLLVLLVAAWPTWAQLSGSLHVAQAIASTSNPGNIHTPLRAWQLFGIWLEGSYLQAPTGAALALTTALIALVGVLALVGVGNLVRSGRYALAGWFAATILLWLALDTLATTWANAKTLMLTSPGVVLVAWAGIAAMRSSRLRIAAPLVACLLVGGVLASDALQYNGSNLAPTARYQELSSINKRFAGRGPTLFTDFDEYALYELRDMDVGGPDFAYPPPALAAAAGGYGEPVDLDRIAPAVLSGYPLIVTRRDPTAVRPPAVYRLLWQGDYYQVWGRRHGAKPALVHLTLSGSPRAQCPRIAHLATSPRARRGLLVGAVVPQIIPVAIPRSRSRRPPGWRRAGRRIVMTRPGTLRLTVRVPHAGAWRVWLQGDVMRDLHVAIDGRQLGSLGEQLDGNSLVANTLAPPLRASLSAGPHTLTITRPGADLAPGDGGAAVLTGVFLAPASSAAGEPRLKTVPVARWRSLCARPLQWVELRSAPAEPA
ncbi:MAG TPA: hypothetical protein VIJ39_04580 [Solirubrobacteraceae bacterium]